MIKKSKNDCDGQQKHHPPTDHRTSVSHQRLGNWAIRRGHIPDGNSYANHDTPNKYEKHTQADDPHHLSTRLPIQNDLRSQQNKKIERAPRFNSLQTSGITVEISEPGPSMIHFKNTRFRRIHVHHVVNRSSGLPGRIAPQEAGLSA